MSSRSCRRPTQIAETLSFEVRLATAPPCSSKGAPAQIEVDNSEWCATFERLDETIYDAHWGQLVVYACVSVEQH